MGEAWPLNFALRIATSSPCRYLADDLVETGRFVGDDVQLCRRHSLCHAPESPVCLAFRHRHSKGQRPRCPIQGQTSV
jgi:hypothetical protein